MKKKQRKKKANKEKKIYTLSIQKRKERKKECDLTMAIQSQRWRFESDLSTSFFNFSLEITTRVYSTVKFLCTLLLT